MTINPISAQTPALDRTTKAETPEKARETENPKVDTFEKSDENSSAEASGIYRLGEDENGNPKILLDKPNQVDKSSKQPEDAQKPEEKKCTVNTDQVDAEIKKLQEKKQEIERQLQAEENVEKRDTLEQQLKSLESELQTKNNDAYRKQQATYTYG